LIDIRVPNTKHTVLLVAHLETKQAKLNKIKSAVIQTSSMGAVLVLQTDALLLTQGLADVLFLDESLHSGGVGEQGGMNSLLIKTLHIALIPLN